MGVGTMYKQRSKTITPPYTVAMSLSQPRQSIRPKRLLRGLLLMLMVSGCATGPSDTRPMVDAVTKTTAVPPPLPAQPEQTIDIQARNTTRHIAMTEGSLQARVQRNALLIQGLDALTATLIESDITWLEGDINTAHQLLDGLVTTDPGSRDLLLAERLQRASQQGLWLKAAGLAHQRLVLSGDAKQQAALKDSLWSLLMRVDDGTLNALLRQSSNRDWKGWLTLAEAYRQGRSAVKNWLTRHPQHAALAPLPSGLNAWLKTATPDTLAIMLPFSGRLASAGESVLKGAVEQLYRRFPDAPTRPRLITIDITQFPGVVSAYQSALAANAEVVIGPLTKSHSQTLAMLDRRPIPVIALNRPKGLSPNQANNWLALSLAPEDEARQIARLAFGQGLRRSITIRPDNDWGRRMEAALQEAWRELGGTAHTSIALSAATPHSEQISKALGGFESEARIAAVEEAFEAPVAARARRYQDFDCIFLLTQGPRDARSLRPLLVFHYSADVPVFATSSIYSGDQARQNRDLNSVIFVEIPAVLNAASTDRFTQLKALGHDAITALDHREQAQVSHLPFAQGATGLLTRMPNGDVERELIPVEFAGDKIRKHRLP